MKKRFFSLALILGMLLALAAPCLAEEEQPAYRLAKVTISDSLGVSENTFAYDNGGWLPTLVSNSAGETTVEYDDAGRMTAYNTPSYSSQYVYNEDGLLAETSMQFDSSWQGGASSHNVFTYDEAGQLIRSEQESDGLNTVVEFVYDEHGNVITETTSAPGGEPDVNTYTYEYNDEGLAISRTYDVTHAWGTATGTYTYAYDEEGRRVSMSYDDGESRYYYMPLLNCEWERMIWTNFDGSGETTGTSESISMYVNLQDAVGATVLNWYCSMTGEPTLEYDDNGYLVRVSDADGNFIEIAYEPVA